MDTQKKNPKEEIDNPFDIRYMKNFLVDIIDLKKGVDKLGTIEEIKARKSMSGANAWMLMCSIIIASIGLDRDSDAVIIGAMLISPLMSPILGVGLGLGTNDKDVVKQSVVHFTAAIVIALVTSFIYFSFSPFGQITPAIASRTEPLTLDVLVAIFGGLAGIISIARKDLSTTLPGVAIATALMPPLCVTGFGLAKGDWIITLNSFYLFIMNSSFISISTYLIVRYLKFPYRRYVNPKERLRNRVMVTIFSLLMVVPSFMILQNVLEKVNTQSKIESFVEDSFGDESIYLDGYKADIVEDSISTLLLKVYGEKINQERIPEYKKKMEDYGLKNWEIQILQSSEVDLDHINNLKTKIADIELITLREKERRIAESERKKETIDTSFIVKLDKEFRILYPEVSEVSYGKMIVSSDSSDIKLIPTLLLLSKDSEIYTSEDKMKFRRYFKNRLEVDSVRVFIH